MKLQWFLCPALFLAASCFAQPDKLYTSLDEALQNKDQVYQLDISGASQPAFTESICEMKNLRVLLLRFKTLEALPECITELEHLETLDLWANNLDSLPESLGKMESLKTLIVGFNQLSVFPGVVSRIPNLERLEMPGNWIDHVPASVSGTATLRYLDLSLNRFPEFPCELASFTGLLYLNLSYNPLGSLPGCVSNLKNLQTLIVKKSKISALTDSIQLMANLRTLDLSENFLTGLPSSMACWPQAPEIRLESNWFNPFCSFTISGSGEILDSLFFGSYKFLRDENCAWLATLFDSLQVTPLGTVVETVQAEHGDVRQAVLVLDTEGSKHEWKLETVYEYGTKSTRHTYTLVWETIRVDAVSGAIIAVKKNSMECRYAPDPWH